MTMYKTKIPYQPVFVTSPGETIADILAEWRMSRSELAQQIGQAVHKIDELIQSKLAITPEIAIQLERVFGISQAYWLTHETHYQAYQQLAAVEEDLCLEGCNR